MRLSPRQQKWVIPPLTLFLRSLGKTWRVRKQGFPCPGPEPQFIDAFNHGHMALFISIYRDTRGVAMISEHRDGQIIAEVVRRFGGTAARGSTTRGGARAFLNMIKNYGHLGWIVTPDGPRGPRGSVQEGIIKMAAEAGRAIRPHGYAVATAKRLRSWDEFTIPYPFTRVVEFVGDPLHVPPQLDRPTRRELAKDLERRLAEASAQAERALSAWLRRPLPVRGEEHDTSSS
ncbi:MAG: lysophospholipid acyltransferase family protein [Planctomycetes bacterium]|nr:lysophospholipid acyltransferase family protein [Planctomycetota bacterium]MCB9871787.1 lysophospholipid acyltransferase family protein [Planctomycetota bacterium]